MKLTGRQQEILTAALKLLADGGMQNLTMAEVGWGLWRL